MMACAVGDTLVEVRSPACSRFGNAAAGGRTEARRPSEARSRPSAGPKVSDPASCRHRHQGVVAGDQRPDDRGQTSTIRTTHLGAQRSAGYAVDENGALRLVFPTPTWEDYLTLAFDEIRHFGPSSVQVMRRMRSALVGLADALPSQERVEVVLRYLEHLDRVIGASPFDVEDKRMARQEDRQGIGLSRRQSDAT